MKLSLILLLLLSIQPTRIKLTVTPLVLVENDSVHIMCRVEKNPDNRWIELGIEGYTSSTRQMDPTSPILYEHYYDHVPCDVGRAYCTVEQSNRKLYTQSTQLTVVGCN